MKQHSGWSQYCAIISTFGMTGFYADLFQRFLPTWLAVGLLVAPVTIILCIEWGELPSRVVAITHLAAATLFLIGAIGMEVGIVLGYRPDGATFFRILTHLGWTFAWALILKRAWTVSTRRNFSRD